jgi:hypothetical protein
MNKINLIKITKTLFALFLILNILIVPIANAASLTSLSNIQSSLKITTASSHAIAFTTPTGAADSTDTIIITFPADFNFTSKTIGTVSFTHGASTGLESTETLAASPSASAWGAVFSGTQNRVLTLTAPTDGIGTAVVAPGDKVIISYTSANSINPTTANTYTVDITGTFGDTGSVTSSILTDDQVVVTALVSQSITFSISDNTIGFGTLLSGGPRFATGDTLGQGTETEANNIVVGTNASNGYTLGVNGTTLTSGANTITAIGSSNTASVPGTEQFGIRATATGGTGTVAVPYAASGFALDTAAFPDQLASATGATNSTTYSMRYIANITANTEAGSYGATLTYTATPNF